MLIYWAQNADGKGSHYNKVGSLGRYLTLHEKVGLLESKLTLVNLYTMHFA